MKNPSSRASDKSHSAQKLAQSEKNDARPEDQVMMAAIRETEAVLELLVQHVQSTLENREPVDQTGFDLEAAYGVRLLAAGCIARLERSHLELVKTRVTRGLVEESTAR